MSESKGHVMGSIADRAAVFGMRAYGDFEHQMVWLIGNGANVVLPVDQVHDWLSEYRNSILLGSS